MARDSLHTQPKLLIRGISILFVLFYLLGVLLPETWWGTHFLAFIPLPLQLLFAILAILSLVFGDRLQLEKINFSSWGVISVLSLGAGLLMHSFPIAMDHYGDAVKFVSFLPQVPSAIPDKASEALFSFGLAPWDGQNTILAMVTYLAWIFQITYHEAFRWMDTGCGVLFVFSWLWFLRRYLKEGVSFHFLALAGLGAPFLLNFFGHTEIYAPVLLSLLWWSVAMVLYLEEGKKIFFWLLLPCWFLVLKLHALGILLGLPMVLVYANLFLPKEMKFERVFKLRNILLFVILPSLVVGLLAYFFVFEDHRDERRLLEVNSALERLFLPLFSPDPPLDRYNLLSLAHIFDFFQIMLLWSPLAWVIVFSGWGIFRRKFNFNSPVFTTVLLVLVLFAALFFATNPLLSMPIDWDLFSLPGVILLVLAAVVLKQCNRLDEKFARQLFPGLLALFLLGIPFFIIHPNPVPHGRRIESLSYRNFQTYYEWTFIDEVQALKMQYQNEDSIFRKMELMIQRLEPLALPANDPEFSRFFIRQGEYLSRIKGDYPKALPWFQRAIEYNPRDGNVIQKAMECYFLLGDYEKSLEYALLLDQMQFPDQVKAQKVVIHAALEAGNYDIAREYAAKYLAQPLDDPSFASLCRDILNGYNLPELKNYFSRN
ncbi:MAG: tetratricopeptide repeat protein [Bacteroidia bacterium]|nr:tetratricopeptide repeat protein [Bacteroidia bacterium]